ncbi:MAG: hypothetical protein SGPRY_004542 [Prymnesium sp.]
MSWKRGLGSGTAIAARVAQTKCKPPEVEAEATLLQASRQALVGEVGESPHRGSHLPPSLPTDYPCTPPLQTDCLHTPPPLKPTITSLDRAEVPERQTTGAPQVARPRPACPKRQKPAERIVPLDSPSSERALPPPPTALSGFVNLGNSCYMNATLQCLATAPLFSRALSELGERVDAASTVGRVLHSLVPLLCRSADEAHDDANGSQHLLEELKRAIASHAPTFALHMQQASHHSVPGALKRSVMVKHGFLLAH